MIYKNGKFNKHMDKLRTIYRDYLLSNKVKANLVFFKHINIYKKILTIKLKSSEASCMPPLLPQS